MDDPMENSSEIQDRDRSETEETEESNDSVPPQQRETTKISYKNSLLGFNGVANGGGLDAEETIQGEEDEEDEIPWKLPEPLEEIKQLMSSYPVVPITQEEFQKWCKPWNRALVITILGKRINLRNMKPRLCKLWNITNFELIDLANNYFIVRFNDKESWKENYSKVLYGGPWVIMQHCLCVQRWTPYFDPSQNSLGRMAIWVRVPFIPIHCYNKHFIWRLGDRIGRTLKVDMGTLSDCMSDDARTERGRFARICVEIDLQKRLVPRIIAANAVFNVEYEGLNVVCFGCGRFGHRKEACPWKCAAGNQTQAEPMERKPVGIPPPKPTPTVGDEFGPWMLVSKTRKARVPKKELEKNPSWEKGESSKTGGKDRMSHRSQDLQLSLTLGKGEITWKMITSMKLQCLLTLTNLKGKPCQM